MNKLVKKVDRSDLIRLFLNSLNGILDLTNRELLLLEMLVEIDMNTPKLPNISKNVISAENRKLINSKLGIGFDNLSKYLKKFKKKGILVENSIADEVVVNKALIPEIIVDRVQITIVLKIDKDEDKRI